MKVKFSHVFKDDKGKDIKHGASDKAVFGDLAVAALFHAKREGQEGEPGGAEKKQRWDLAVKVKNFGDQAELSKEDVELLKAVMAQAYHTLIAAPALYMLEGKECPQFQSGDTEQAL